MRSISPRTLSGFIAAFATFVGLFAQPTAPTDPFGQEIKSFADFCRSNPTEDKPVGDHPIWVDVVTVEVISPVPPRPSELTEMKAAVDALDQPAKPASKQIQGEVAEQPSAEFLRSGRLTRLETRVNRCAGFDDWQWVDRAPDGRKPEQAVRIGRALYVRVLRNGDGTYALSIHISARQLEAWQDSAGRPMAITSGREVDTLFNLFLGDAEAAGPWIKFGGLARESVVNGVNQKVSTFFCVRLSRTPTPAVE